MGNLGHGCNEPWKISASSTNGGDISDEEYRTERSVLVRQLKLLDDAVKPRQLPNLERAAEFLQDLPRLWLHPGVTHEEREALVKQVFQRITIDGKDFVDIEPKPEYAPLFATMVTGQKVGYRETDSPPSPPEPQIRRPEGQVSLGRLEYLG